MLRRDFSLFIKCLMSALGLLAVLISVSVLAASAVIHAAKSAYTPASVAVVDDDDSALSRIIISAVGEMDAVAGLLEVETMDYSSAMDALDSGDCAAAIVLPDGFVDDFMSGRETVGTIYISPSAGAQADIIEAVTGFGERLLLAGQNAVLAGDRLMISHRLGTDARASYLKKADLILVGGALNASERYFTVETLDYSGTGMTLTAHFSLCFMLMLLFMLSLFFIPLTSRDATRPMLSRLRACGIGNVRFMAWKLALLLLLRTVLLTAFVLLFGSSVGIVKNIASAASLLVTCAYVTLIGTALTMCVGDPITGNAISALGGMLLCGGIVPRALLPTAVTFIGGLTPYGAARSLAAPMFGTVPSVAELIFAVIYAFLAAVLINIKLNTIISGRTRA